MQSTVLTTNNYAKLLMLADTLLSSYSLKININIVNLKEKEMRKIYSNFGSLNAMAKKCLILDSNLLSFKTIMNLKIILKRRMMILRKILKKRNMFLKVLLKKRSQKKLKKLMDIQKKLEEGIIKLKCLKWKKSIKIMFLE